VLSRSTRSLSLAAVFAAALIVTARPALADTDADDFRANCASCHTIGGGKLVGPDLKGVLTRQKREWLARFILAPQDVIASGDAYAQKLVAEARNVVMPPVGGMTAKRAEALLTLIEAEGKLEKSRFASTGVSERAFTAADVETGREYFVGAKRLVGGASPCIACHDVNGVGSLGGGRLGPDLSAVWGRLGGRKPLGAWFLAPPTPTMKPQFSTHPLEPETEILPLLAFLEDASRRGESDRLGDRLTFVLLGCGAAGIGLVLMDQAWRRRLTGVRAQLVKGAR
jgi:cytochrome c2